MFDEGDVFSRVFGISLFGLLFRLLLIIFFYFEYIFILIIGEKVVSLFRIYILYA